MTEKNVTFRQNILNNDEECLVYGTDNLAQFTRRRAPCSFEYLARETSSILYDGRTFSSYFSYNCANLSKTGDFAAILMAEDLDAIAYLEKEMNRFGIL